MFTKLTERLYLINGERDGKFPFANGLLVEGNIKALVDTGFGPSGRQAVQENYAIEVIINTHYHLDHAYGNRFFPEAEVWAHSLDAPALRSEAMFKAFTGFNKIGGLIDNRNFPGGLEPREVVRELQHQELLDFGGIELKVIHSPGHTPGHIALFEPKEQILFSADIDLSSFGPWYGNPASSVTEFTASIDRLLELNSKILVTSHSGIVTENIPARLREYAAVINQRECRIVQQLRSAKTMQELVDEKIIFFRHPEPQKLYRLFEENMLNKHLVRLVNQGKVEIRADKKFRACI